jgi:hypothetical protein
MNAVRVLIKAAHLRTRTSPPDSEMISRQLDDNQPGNFEASTTYLVDVRYLFIHSSQWRLETVSYFILNTCHAFLTIVVIEFVCCQIPVVGEASSSYDSRGQRITAEDHMASSAADEH